MKTYDTVIIGSGPAGLSAAVYASRALLDCVVLEQAAVSGGQMMNTSDIDNYPGFLSVDGFALSTKMREHAEGLGAVFVTEQVRGAGARGQSLADYRGAGGIPDQNHCGRERRPAPEAPCGRGGPAGG